MYRSLEASAQGTSVQPLKVSSLGAWKLEGFFQKFLEGSENLPEAFQNLPEALVNLP